MSISDQAFASAQQAELANWQKHRRSTLMILHELVENSSVAGPLRSYVREPIDKALDVGVGCFGLGFLAVHFADLIAHVDGLDPLPRLEIQVADPALQDYVDAIRARVSYTAGKGEELPYTSGSYDLVSCINVVDHAQDPERIVSEIHRVLKPNGLLVLSVNTLSWLGQLKWRFHRARRPDEWLYVAHPHIYQWAEADRVLRKYFRDVLWHDRPSARKQFAGHGRMSSWILRKSNNAQ